MTGLNRRAITLAATLLLSAALPFSGCSDASLAFSGAVTGCPQDGGADNTLAPACNTAQAGPVDGIKCETNEQLAFHIHAHLAMYASGQPRLVAAGIGISSNCFSWLHTHDTSGVIHIESPVQRTFTLGNFFDIWGQALGPNQMGPVGGQVTAYLNGQPFMGDPTTIPLDAHNVVQLDVGVPAVPPQPFTFPMGF